MNDAIRDFVLRRDEALRTLDLAYAREALAHRGEFDDETLLVAMHKARYEVRGMDPVLREESRAFLEERGSTRLGDAPWPPKGELP